MECFQCHQHGGDLFQGLRIQSRPWELGRELGDQFCRDVLRGQLFQCRPEQLVYGIGDQHDIDVHWCHSVQFEFEWLGRVRRDPSHELLRELPEFQFTVGCLGCGAGDCFRPPLLQCSRLQSTVEQLGCEQRNIVSKHVPRLHLVQPKLEQLGRFRCNQLPRNVSQGSSL